MHGLFPACCCLIWKALCRSFRWNRWHYLSKSPHHGVFGAKNMIFRRHTTPISPNTSWIMLDPISIWVWVKVGYPKWRKTRSLQFVSPTKTGPQWTPDFPPQIFPHIFPAIFPLCQVKADLEMLRNDGLGPEDSQTALKQRLLDLTKKNRRLQVAGECWGWDLELGFLGVFGPKKHCLTGEVKLPKMVGEHHCSILSDLSVDSVQL